MSNARDFHEHVGVDEWSEESEVIGKFSNDETTIWLHRLPDSEDRAGEYRLIWTDGINEWHEHLPSKALGFGRFGALIQCLGYDDERHVGLQPVDEWIVAQMADAR